MEPLAEANRVQGPGVPVEAGPEAVAPQDLLSEGARGALAGESKHPEVRSKHGRSGQRS